MNDFDRMPDPRTASSSSGQRARRALLGADLEPTAAAADGTRPTPGAAPTADPAATATAPGRPGVTCTRCRRSSVLDPESLLTLLRPPVVWLPWRQAPLRAVCPACRRRAWLEPERLVVAPD